MAKKETDQMVRKPVRRKRLVKKEVEPQAQPPGVTPPPVEWWEGDVVPPKPTEPLLSGEADLAVVADQTVIAGTKAQYQGEEVELVRKSLPVDAGFDADQDQVVIKMKSDPHLKVVKRSELT